MQRMFLWFLFLLVSFIIKNCLLAQGSETLAERLGYAKDAKLLMVHAEDPGVAHSQNIASIAATEKGTMNSGAIYGLLPMVPRDCRIRQRTSLF
jgi:hypothetical protein